MHWFHLSSYKFRIIRSSEGAELAPLCLSPAFPETVLPETMAGYGRVYVPSLRNYVIHSHLNGCQWRRSKSFLSLLPAFLEFSCPFLHVGSPRSQASSVLPTGIPRQEMASNGCTDSVVWNVFWYFLIPLARCFALQCFTLSMNAHSYRRMKECVKICEISSALKIILEL
jgi:hypothetical protein